MYVVTCYNSSGLASSLERHIRQHQHSIAACCADKPTTAATLNTTASSKLLAVLFSTTHTTLIAAVAVRSRLVWLALVLMSAPGALAMLPPVD